jgi:hypothetical protein
VFDELAFDPKVFVSGEDGDRLDGVGLVDKDGYGYVIKITNA